MYRILIPSFVLLAACKPDTEDSDSTSTESASDSGDSVDTQDSEETVPAAVVHISAPEDGSTLTASRTSIAFSVENFAFDLEHPGPQSGYVNIYDNDTLVGNTVSSPIDVSGLWNGSHILKLVLVDVSGELETSDAITITADSPNLRIIDPVSPASVIGSSVEMHVEVSSFPLVNGEGHMEVWVDNALFDTTVDPTRIVAPRLAPGSHQAEVRLVQRDGSPAEVGGVCGVDNLTCGQITVEVPEAAPTLTLASVESGYRSATVPANLSYPGFKLTTHKNEPPISGVGHFNFYVDGVFTTEGFAFDNLVPHVPGGRHTLEVRVAGQDDVEVGIVDYQYIDVAMDRTDFTTNLKPGDSVSSPYELEILTENFALVDKNTPQLPGEGHYYIEIDGFVSYEDYLPTCSLTFPFSGTHEIYVQLVNNDGTLVEPIVQDHLFVDSL